MPLERCVAAVVVDWLLDVVDEGAAVDEVAPPVSAEDVALLVLEVSVDSDCDVLALVVGVVPVLDVVSVGDAVLASGVGLAVEVVPVLEVGATVAVGLAAPDSELVVEIVTTGAVVPRLIVPDTLVAPESVLVVAEVLELLVVEAVLIAVVNALEMAAVTAACCTASRVRTPF